MIRYMLALILMTLVTTPALAGTVAVYVDPQREDRRLQIEVADNGDMRIGMPDEDMYGIMTGGVFHIVSKAKDGWKVARMTDFAAAYDKMLPPMLKGSPSTATPVELTIEKRGQRRVNGHLGTIYEVKGFEKDSKRAKEFVISDDPALAPVKQALTHFMEATLIFVRPLLGAEATNMIDKSRRIFALGTLIDSPSFRLQSIETIDVDPQRMVLPATPKTLDELIAEMTKRSAAIPTD